MKAGSVDSRLRILLLYELLQKHTDENHMLSTHRIMELMEQEHGFKMHRTTVPRDVEILRSAGVDVMTEKKRTQYYYLGERQLSLPELRLLADAVLASRFITEQKSEQLLTKLGSMTSLANAEKLRRVIHTTGKPKTDNEKGYYIIDAINEAMSSGRKISLFYCDYDIRKNRVRRNQGDPYTVSPYDLIWDGDYYYMTGFCDERGEVRTFRVDRIEHQPTLLETAAEPRPADYRVERYTQEVFRMFASQETETVTLLCDAGVIVLGNINAERFDINKNMVENISEVFGESATLDRFHGFIPGWQIPRMTTGLIAKGWAINTEYFAEVLHALREDLSYAAIVEDLIT